MMHPDPNGPCDVTHEKAPVYFACMINDAERLMQYAAEIGIEVSDETRRSVLRARATYPDHWDEDIAAGLLSAITALAARLKPVNAESLKAYHDDTRPTVRTYLRIAIALAVVIIPVSVASFMTSAISNALSSDINRANAYAVKLQTELGPPQPAGSAVQPIPKGIDENELVADLQDYAATVRVINARARKLNHFIIPYHHLPQEDVGTPEQRKLRFELPVGIPDPIAARDRITNTYQDVRYFALNIQTDVSVFYGAISTCILPVLYALLGTCAYLLRSFEDQMNSRTFTPSAANSARFLIAAICGAVIGLFNNLSVNQGISIPPLALAFLVGYAVDVFFSFLEGILKAFTKNSLPSPVVAPAGALPQSPPPAPKPKPVGTTLVPPTAPMVSPASAVTTHASQAS